MQQKVRISDPWLHSINMLSPQSEFTIQVQRKTEMEMRRAARANRNARAEKNSIVKILDKPTETTATVAWFDSTSCCYGDQTWLLRVARSSGTCALTGEPVSKGDHVYQPRSRSPRPLNANEMILSSVVKCEISFKSNQPSFSSDTTEFERRAA
jgi:hypothetical protein